ncbi:acyl-CoA dehydrogenase family protein [Streptomyces sp. NPDC004629]|uniref:acyl-CoA dehydrogenase family protein n=1 Tax=Streptomyces sp. NPDC004629 TaxID=3364705 RepID=UPI0036CED3CE
MDAADALNRRGTALHGAPWGDVRLESLPAGKVTPLDRPAEDVIDLAVCGGALARCVQSLAALRRLRELSVAHVTSRQQFGRRLVAFQAVQQHLAVLAGEVAAAEAAVRVLLDATNAVAPLVGDPRLATARIRTSQAAEEASRIAHQVHGAIGTAREYELHRHTMALWSWREEFGNEHYWADRLIAGVDPVSDLWAWIADS